MLTLLLTACHVFESPEIRFTCDEIPECSEDDTATLPTDEDTGTPPTDEDCDDGIDNNLNGLVDCEDDDCLEVCIEDCTDGIDNDQDTFIDCGDDECYGLDGCGGPYSVQMYTAFTQVAHIIGSDLPILNSSYTHSIALLAEGSIEVSGAPVGWDGGAPFSCQGTIAGGFDVLGYTDVFTYIGPQDDGSYAMGFQPSELTSTLLWDSDCPLTVLPYSILSFMPQQRYISQEYDGSWRRQYYAQDYITATYTDFNMEVTQLYEVLPYHIIEWTGAY